MPSFSARALVLNKTKLGETDLIITALSEDGSQIRAVAHGARKPNSRFSASLELCSEVDLLLNTGRNLATVTEARVLDSHAGCRSSVEHTTAASVVVEALAKFSQEGAEEPRIFAFSRAALSAIDDSEYERLAMLAAASVIKLCSMVGFRPSIGRCALCGAPCTAERFSLSAGGTLCSACNRVDTVQQGLWQHESIEWFDTLINSTFRELKSFAFDDLQSCALLGRNMAVLSRIWLQTHVGIKLKSLDFLIESGLFG